MGGFVVHAALAACRANEAVLGGVLGVGAAAQVAIGGAVPDGPEGCLGEAAHERVGGVAAGPDLAVPADEHDLPGVAAVEVGLGLGPAETAGEFEREAAVLRARFGEVEHGVGEVLVVEEGFLPQVLGVHDEVLDGELVHAEVGGEVHHSRELLDVAPHGDEDDVDGGRLCGGLALEPDDLADALLDVGEGDAGSDGAVGVGVGGVDADVEEAEAAGDELLGSVFGEPVAACLEGDSGSERAEAVEVAIEAASDEGLAEAAEDDEADAGEHACEVVEGALAEIAVGPGAVAASAHEAIDGAAAGDFEEEGAGRGAHHLDLSGGLTGVEVGLPELRRAAAQAGDSEGGQVPPPVSLPQTAGGPADNSGPGRDAHRHALFRDVCGGFRLDALLPLLATAKVMG